MANSKFCKWKIGFYNIGIDVIAIKRGVKSENTEHLSL